MALFLFCEICTEYFAKFLSTVVCTCFPGAPPFLKSYRLPWVRYSKRGNWDISYNFIHPPEEWAKGHPIWHSWSYKVHSSHMHVTPGPALGFGKFRREIFFLLIKDFEISRKEYFCLMPLKKFRCCAAPVVLVLTRALTRTCEFVISWNHKRAALYALRTYDISSDTF